MDPSFSRGRLSSGRALLPIVALVSLLGAPRAAGAAAPAQVVDVLFQGNDHLPRRELAAAIGTRKATIFRGSPLDPALLATDVRVLENVYREHGYLAVHVEATQRDVNVRTLPHQVAVCFVVQEGPQTTVSSVEFVGNTVFSSERLLAAVQVKAPLPLAPMELERDLYRLTGLYLDEAYLEAHVELESEDVGNQRRLRYRIEEGTRFRLGQVRLEGNHATRDHVIRRELTLSAGDYLRRSEVLRSQQNIYDTGLFSQVDLVPLPAAEDSGRLDLTVRVREQKSRWLGAGLGYGTQDGLRLSGEWGDRNLAGAGRRLDVNALLATALFPQETQRVRGEASLTQPRILGEHSTVTLDHYVERLEEDYLENNIRIGSYDVQTVALSATLRRDLSKRSHFWFTYSEKWLRLKAPTFPATPDVLEELGFDDRQRAQEAGISLILERDHRDDPLNPTRGTRGRFEADLAAGRPWGLSRPYGKFTFSQGWHWRLGGRGTMAWKINGGAVKAFDASIPVPDRERFKIGGETTLRGYPDRELGPGDLMLTASAEAALPLVDVVQGLLFVDGGGVWGNRRDLALRQFFSLTGRGAVRYTVGTGLRIPTPVGALRLGYGVQVRHRMSVAVGRPYVVFGQAF